MTLIKGANEYVYFLIHRELECIGVGDATDKTFTTAQHPIADSTLSGTVDTSDVEVYVGASRATATAVTVSAVTEATGEITLTAAPALAAKIYCTYKHVYGFVTYAQEYSVTSSLDTSSITPLSSANEETIENSWKYEGTVKLWDNSDIEDNLYAGIDQTDDTVGGIMADEFPIPVPTHHMVIKKVRGAVPKYRVLKDVKFTSLDEGGKGGENSEKSFKITATNYIRDYTPTVGSGM